MSRWISRRHQSGQKEAREDEFGGAHIALGRLRATFNLIAAKRHHVYVNELDASRNVTHKVHSPDLLRLEAESICPCCIITVLHHKILAIKNDSEEDLS